MKLLRPFCLLFCLAIGLRFILANDYSMNTFDYVDAESSAKYDPRTSPDCGSVHVLAIRFEDVDVEDVSARVTIRCHEKRYEKTDSGTFQSEKKLFSVVFNTEELPSGKDADFKTMTMAPFDPTRYVGGKVFVDRDRCELLVEAMDGSNAVGFAKFYLSEGALGDEEVPYKLCRSERVVMFSSENKGNIKVCYRFAPARESFVCPWYRFVVKTQLFYHKEVSTESLLSKWMGRRRSRPIDDIASVFQVANGFPNLGPASEVFEAGISVLADSFYGLWDLPYDDITSSLRLTSGSYFEKLFHGASTFAVKNAMLYNCNKEMCEKEQIRESWDFGEPMMAICLYDSKGNEEMGRKPGPHWFYLAVTSRDVLGRQEGYFDLFHVNCQKDDGGLNDW